MSASVRVLGVLGWCWVAFGRPTHIPLPGLLVWRPSVLSVLGLPTRTRRRVTFSGANQGRSKAHANTEKPNKPNTLNSDSNNPLISLSFKCVGFVSGWLNVCWVLISEGWR